LVINTLTRGMHTSTKVSRLRFIDEKS